MVLAKLHPPRKDLQKGPSKIFRDFFYDEIAGGAQRFDMPHPYDGDLVSFRIDMSAGPPSVSPEPGNRWLVSFTLEELP